MPIAKLAPDTARLIGSSAGITSPAAVVKELLDNAIDAGADNVEVAISANTLDQIRVRDNGRGITLHDLDSIGRPSHTSKLGTFDELTTGRVQTLGFRGQALASINNVATVHVITKTADEPVAAKMQMAPSCGGIGKRCAPMSTTTGTTVQINGLFDNMPPRKHFLLKEIKRTLAKIKDTLLAYALANSDLRIAFKVLGDEKQSCKYGQTRSRDIKQSVLELFGPSVAAHGETHRFAQDDTFTLVAFLPRAEDGDQKAIAGKGSFIAVNGRPICSSTGIGKALTTVFKTKIQQSWQLRGLSTVQKPLLLLDILCPFASYDANIATMKDDVLFADSSSLLQTFEDLCETVYNRLPSKELSNSSAKCHGVDFPTTPPSEKLVLVQMRTASNVNMLRTNSNATDEGADFQTVEVTVPQRKQPCVNSLGNSVSLKDVPKAVRGIEQYFRTTQADFEIATDDTATQEQPNVDDDEICDENPSPRERPPLHDIPDSALNILAGMDSASDVSSQGDAPRLSNLNSTSWSIQNLINQNMLQAPSRGSTASASPPPRQVPQTRGQQQHRPLTLESAQLPMVRTPPPSDPTREEPRFVSAFQVMGSNVRRQLSPASSSSAQSSVHVKEMRRSALSPEPERRVLLQNRLLLQPDRQGAPLGMARPRQLLAGRPRQQMRVERLARLQQYEERDEPASPERENNSFRPINRVDGTRMRLPDVDQQTDAEMAIDTPPLPKRRRIDDDEVNQGRPFDLCRKKSLIAGSLDQLPLESIPPGMGTWRSILTTDVSFCDVRISMNIVRDLDFYIRSGMLGYGLKNITQHEAIILESRVRRLCSV